MKKLFFTLALLAGSMATYAQATEPSGCTMSVASFDIKPGKSATFDINLESSARNDINTFQVYVNIPDGWALTNPTATTRTSGYTVDNPADHGSATRFYVYGYHGQGQVITGTDGGIITLTLEAPASVNVGEKYTITCDGAMLSNGGAELDVEDFSFEVTVVEDKLDLYDDAVADPAESDATENVILHRNLTANIWNSFVVPFDMNATQIEEAFGEGAIVAELTAWTCDNYTAFDCTEITLGFSTVNAITANSPVIVKPTKAATYAEGISITAVDGIHPAAASKTASTTVGTGRNAKTYSISATGTYVPTVLGGSGEEFFNQLYLKSNKFYFADQETTMKGYRAYIEMGSYNLPSIWEVKMVFDEELTAINGIDVDRTNSKVYTVDGKYVGKDVNRMQKGVYIVNGKKVIK
jgi:hypothetical protein